MAEHGRDQRDIVLAPNEFAHVQDKTKGEISTYVGPHKLTLSGDDLPVVFDARDKRFREVGSSSEVRQRFITAPAGWYVVLLNPASKHPKIGQKNSTPDDMAVGKKIVIPGPVSFALWPGQMAEVVEGHQLRSNEYLLIEVYDVEAAKDAWNTARVEEVDSNPTGKENDDDGNGEGTKKSSKKSIEDEKVEEVKEVTSIFAQVPVDIANGRRYVIRGTDVAFYMPPSGVKVVRDPDSGKFTREAVTLEMLEYAVLKGENGEQNFHRGPAVVFPDPTQRFKTGRSGSKKFRAFELDERKGLFVKVIEDYVDEASAARFLMPDVRESRVNKDKCQFKTGDELFITGEGVIYFPRKEHNIIKYGDEEVHYAIAIPKGEGRYVLDRRGGGVLLIKGEKMFLPDPRIYVVTRRILSDKECELLYPNNDEVLDFNRSLRQKFDGMAPESVAAATTVQMEEAHRLSRGSGADHYSMRSFDADAEKNFGGESFSRRTGFTKPRTVPLNTKLDGAVTLDIWTGYAIKVVDRDGKSRVEIGPKPLMLEYDEKVEAMVLSTGKPKTTDRLLRTVYLRVHGNKVSDIIRCVSSDLVEFDVKLSYRVNFEGDDPQQWFAVENYVKFLCDHARSVIKGVMKKTSIQEALDNATDIVRTAVLGVKPEEGERVGMRFDENCMTVYDVEVLNVEISDRSIRQMLMDAQQRNITSALTLRQRSREVSDKKQLESLSREELDATRLTSQKVHDVNLAEQAEVTALNRKRAEDDDDLKKLDADFARSREEASQMHKLKLSDANSAHERALAEKRAEHQRKLAADAIAHQAELLATEKAIAAERLELKKADHDLDLQIQTAFADLAKAATQTKVEAAKTVAAAFSPQLVEAILSMRDSDLISKLSEHFSDLSVLEGRDLLSTVSRALGSDLMQNVAPVIDHFIKKTNAVEAEEELDPGK